MKDHYEKLAYLFSFMEQLALRLFNKKTTLYTGLVWRLNLFHFWNFVSGCLFAVCVPIKVWLLLENVGLYNYKLFSFSKNLSHRSKCPSASSFWGVKCAILKWSKETNGTFSATNLYVFPLKCKTILSAHEANSTPVFGTL